MPIVGIAGDIGAGKTGAMTYFLLQERLELGKPLFTNYHLTGVDFVYLTFQDFIALAVAKTPFVRAAIGLDEIHIWMDSRTAATKRNRLVSYILNQSGKLDMNCYYTTQSFDQVDKRLRNRTDIIVMVTDPCGGGIDKPCTCGRIKVECTNRMSLTERGRSRKFYIRKADVGDYYDTREVVAFA